MAHSVLVKDINCMHITRTIRTIIAFENGVIFNPHVETTQLFQMSKRTVKLSGKFRLLFNDLRTFPTLSDLCLFSGITYRLTKSQGEFLSLQQYNLGRGKVGEGWKG